MIPSNDLINEWLMVAEVSQQPRFLTFATLAAEWGAKQEREACLKLATEAGRNKAGVAAAIRARGEVKP